MFINRLTWLPRLGIRNYAINYRYLVHRGTEYRSEAEHTLTIPEYDYDHITTQLKGSFKSVHKERIERILSGYDDNRTELQLDKVDHIRFKKDDLVILEIANTGVDDFKDDGERLTTYILQHDL